MPKSLKITLILLAIGAVITVATFLTYSGINAFKKVDISIEPDKTHFYYTSDKSTYICILNDTAFIRSDTSVQHYTCTIADGNLIELKKRDAGQETTLQGIFISTDTIYLSTLRQYFYKEQ